MRPADPTAPAVNARLDGLSDYPFARLASLLAEVTPRANVEPLYLSVGEPQHAPPPLLVETMAANAHLWGKYPPVAGTADWRQAVADWLARRYALPAGFVDPDRGILPATGTREALFLLAQAVVPQEKAGQRPAVLIPNPFYAVYQGAAVLAGADPVLLPAFADTGFLPDLDAVGEDVWARTALFYLCTPANPQGAIADPAYLRRALALARRHGFVLAVDECYAEIWDKAPPPGALEAARDTGTTANLLVFHSLSKRSGAAGLRSGFVAGDPDLIQPFQRLRNYSFAGNPLPALAAAAALWRDEAHVEENRRLYRAKIDAAEAELRGRYDFYRPPGGFFLWLNVGDGERAAQALWREGGIRVLPGAYLAQPEPDGTNRARSYIRVALVHEAETVSRACAGIARILG